MESKISFSRQCRQCCQGSTNSQIDRRSRENYETTSRNSPRIQIEEFFRRRCDDTTRVKQHRRRRSCVYIYTKIVASSLYFEVELNLTPKQMSMFIKGLKYIIPCQSQFSKKTMDERSQEQYQAFITVIKSCLRDNQMSESDERARQAFAELQQLNHDLHLRTMPYHLNIRAKREYGLVKSIRRLIHRQPNIVVRRTDKSKVFYLGKIEDFLVKANDYISKSEAYIELSDQ